MNSCDHPFVVGAPNDAQGVKSEYDYLSTHYPGYQVGLQGVLASCHGKPVRGWVDMLLFLTADGQPTIVYFDLSSADRDKS